MSAQTLESVSINLARPIKDEATSLVQTAKDYPSVISGLPFEAVYQVCFAPAPTPEQVAREIFLLECD